MIRRFFLLVLATFAFSLAAPRAHAHGGHEHLMGVITALASSAITLKTSDDHTVKVLVNEATKYERDGKPAAFGDLKVGQRAVIHATKLEGSADLTATVVKLAGDDAHK